MDNPERAVRSRSLLGARIIFNNGSSTVDCMVRNISGSGAKVTLDSVIDLPDEFQLNIPQRGKTYWARVAWRNHSELGLMLSATQTDPALMAGGAGTEDLLVECRRLGEENVKLRAIVRQLRAALVEKKQNRI